MPRQDQKIDELVKITVAFPGRAVPKEGRVSVVSIKIYPDTSCQTKVEMLREIFKKVFLSEGVQNTEFNSRVMTELEILKNQF